ncbi:MAG: MerR family transcriptional regulator [Pseudomonadota bacterium]
MKQTTFSIGAVSKILGVSTHALRKWEDRHSAIHPSRSAGGDRRYSSDDLDRLSKLKSLVDYGHAIGALATLSNAELEQLLSSTPLADAAEHRHLAVGVVGERMAYELRQAGSRMPNIEVTAHAARADALTNVDADAIVIELGSLGEDTQRELAQIRATTGVERIVIVYGYGSIEAAERLSDARTALVRRPLNHREFARTVVALVGAPIVEATQLDLPPHRFSREVLARMAMISPELACECPRHVGQLLIELTDFELYSAECEITKPHDAAIHNMLRRTAASSRALFERALVELADAEGIDLDEARSDPRLHKAD